MNKILKKIKSLYKKYFKKDDYEGDAINLFKQIEKNLIDIFDKILGILLKKTDGSEKEKYLSILSDEMYKNILKKDEICSEFPHIEMLFLQSLMIKWSFTDPINEFESILKLDLPFLLEKREDWHNRFLENVKTKKPMWKDFLKTPCFKKCADISGRIEPMDGYYIYPPDEFVIEYFINEYKITLINFFKNVLKFHNNDVKATIKDTTIDNYVDRLNELRNFLLKNYQIDLFEISLKDVIESKK